MKAGKAHNANNLPQVSAGRFSIALKSALAIYVSLIFVGTTIASGLKVAPIFTDNMVLQREVNVPVWGSGLPGAKVTVEFSGQRKITKIGSDGKWRVNLSPLKASATGSEFKVESDNEVLVFNDVLVGEVWLASGQSNMEFKLANAARANEEIAAANYEGLRVFTVQLQYAQAPQADVQGTWCHCTPGNARSFSAVAYYFGRDLHTNLNIPVGMIVSSEGGTPIETWTAPDVVAADPESQPLLDQWKNITPEEFHQIDVTYRDFFKERDRRAKAGVSAEAQPPLIRPQKDCRMCPSALFDGMIAPLIPYAIRGVIWYQGENNTGRPVRYAKQFPAMIQQWRRDWHEGDFPFYFVQLANYVPDPGLKDGYAVLRESQRRTLDFPNTGMAVAIDLGEANNIHPLNKQDVGRRLALWALAKTYGDKDLIYTGPLYKSSKVRGDRVIVQFKPTGSHLVARGESLNGFEVSGSDGKFVPAEAVIVGDVVEVHSQLVPHPLSVRYAFANNPAGCNLYNAAGLPASPFSTAVEKR